MSHNYVQLPQNNERHLQKEEKETNSCCNCFYWLLSFIIWISLISSLYFLNTVNNKNADAENISYITLGISYFLYIILEFCSTTAKYLRNKKTGEEMYDKMGSLFRAHPNITFHCQCYHYEIIHYTSRDKDGKIHHETRREKRITYTDSYSIPYYSSRDVSGLFYLNCDEAYAKKKCYIQLKLKEEINFADEISYMDYEYYKDQFWRKNRFRDVYMDFNETRTIPGLVHHNLIRIGQSDPCIVSFGWFSIFTLLSVCEFYKLYINSLFVYQSYKIRKIVSTRYNLNEPIYEEKYTQLVPQLNLISKQYNYEPDYYNYVNQDANIDLPTKEELERAGQYKDKIPDYKISSGNGTVQPGVIVDNPNYSKLDLNEPPKLFKPISGEIGLNEDQINSEGAPPIGFGEPGFQFNRIQNNPNDISMTPNNEYQSI